MGKVLVREKIKTVIDALKKGPKAWSELAKLGVSDKSLQRILHDYLEFWGLAFKDEKDGKWSWILRKSVFETKRDYDLAMEHSRRVVFGENRRLDSRLGVANAGVGALLQRFSLDANQEPEFFQHLESGYAELFAEFERWARLLQKREGYLKGSKGFRRILEHELQERERFLKVSKGSRRLEQQGEDTSKTGENKEWISFNVGYDLNIGAFMKKEGLNGSWFKHSPEGFSAEEMKHLRKLDEELTSIAESVAAELSVAFLRVENGIPLDGYCQYCPHKELTIKE